MVRKANQPKAVRHHGYRRKLHFFISFITVHWVLYCIKPDHLPSVPPSSLYLLGQDTSPGLIPLLSLALTPSPSNFCFSSSPPSSCSFPAPPSCPLKSALGSAEQKGKKQKKTPYPPWHSWFGVGWRVGVAMTPPESSRGDQRQLLSAAPR